MALNITDVEVTNANPLQDLNSHVFGKRVPPITFCITDGECIDEQPISCPSCPDDMGFQFLVKDGDRIPLQFRIVDRYNLDIFNPAYGWKESSGATKWWMNLEIMDRTGSVVYSDGVAGIASAWKVSFSPDAAGFYQNIILKAEDIRSKLPASEKCFYLRLVVRRSYAVGGYTLAQDSAVDPGPPASLIEDGAIVINTVSNLLWTQDRTTWISSVPDEGDRFYVQSSGLWYVFTAGAFVLSPGLAGDETAVGEDYCSTQMYRFDSCRDTVLIDGYFDELDSIGHYYGNEDTSGGPGFGDATFWIRMRLRGEFQVVAFPTEREISGNGRWIKTTTWEDARMRLFPCPERVARKVSEAINAGTVVVNGTEFDEAQEVQKRNDEGANWMIDVTLRRKIAELRSVCD